MIEIRKVLTILTVLGLLLTMISLESVYGEEIEPEVERHAPILGNTSLDIEYLQQLVENLSKNISDPQLTNILSEINQSLTINDTQKYNEAVGKLNLYLNNLDEEQLAGMDEDTLKKLALLASSTLGGDGVVADMDKYFSLINELYREKGELIPPGEIFLNETLGEQSFGTNESNPFPELPNVSVAPPGGLSSRSKQKSSLTDLVKLILITSIIGLILGFTYVRTDYLRKYLRKISNKIIVRFQSRKLGKPSTPRDAIINCFQTLVKLVERIGRGKEPWETPREFLSKNVGGSFRSIIEKAIYLYEKAVYAGKQVSWDDAEDCERSVREVSKY